VLVPVVGVGDMRLLVFQRRVLVLGEFALRARRIELVQSSFELEIDRFVNPTSTSSSFCAGT